MILNLVLGVLALISLILLLWQWLVAVRFPLHQRTVSHPFPLAVSLLKPLKGCDPETEACLRSWFAQEYTGRVQLLFGVASAEDPVCHVVRQLQQEFPNSDAQLIVCNAQRGANAKVSKLIELETLAQHELLIVSDADVRVPADFLSNIVEPLRDSGATNVKPVFGLVNCFYRLANPSTLAMHWEAIAINSDFWSQVLQAITLKPLDFALGAVMATRKQHLKEIGGFAALKDCLADDYQLGHRIAAQGHRIALSTVVVECCSPPSNWPAVWKHQLRWARTIRVCQPLPYFFSIISNPTLWPLACALAHPPFAVLLGCAGCGVVRIGMALDLQRRLLRSRAHYRYAWMVPIKDLLQAIIWALAFAGNKVEWRGEKLRLRPDGSLVREFKP